MLAVDSPDALANAAGTTTLDGAEISGSSIDVAIKGLTFLTAH
jgi:hypothetical protein